MEQAGSGGEGGNGGGGGRSFLKTISNRLRGVDNSIEARLAVATREMQEAEGDVTQTKLELE